MLNVTKGDEHTRYFFEKVLVATGPFNRPHIPSILGMETFNRKVMHARAYKG